MKPLPMVQLSEEALREKEAKYCSHGDTVHYSPVPKFFQNCEGASFTTAMINPTSICKCGTRRSISVIATRLSSMR